MSEAFQTEFTGKNKQLMMANAGLSEYKQGMAEVERKYAAQFAELQKDGKCNHEPRFSNLDK